MFIKINETWGYVYNIKHYKMIERKSVIMKIHVVSAEFENEQWYAVKAFMDEEEADDYAIEIYQNGCCDGNKVVDSRVDEVSLIQ